MSVMKVGDPVTYVVAITLHDSGRGRAFRVDLGLHHDFVDGGHDKIPEPTEVGFWLRGNGTPVLWMEAEGLRWIRGHCRRDTPEGQALLAAYKLARSAA